MENEKDIVLKVAANDENAFKKLFEHYYPKVKIFLEEFISNADDAMDLAQNIFIKIWLQRSNLAKIRSFGAFLYTMSRNAAIDYGRTHKIKIPLTDTELKWKDDYDAESSFYAKEIEVQIAHTISTMPEKRKMVFVMSRFEGRSNVEIAQILNISKKTVENHINLALKEIRKITKVLSIFLA